jgi:nitronate monooxygenase
VSFRVVQAPMANNQPPGFAALVSAAGALGTVAGAYLSADELRDELRAMPDVPYGVNLFAPPYLNEDALAVVVEARPAVFSFTFGVIDPAPLQDAGIEVWGTATSVEEAGYLRAAGVDAVVAQGAEAGGHRGSFIDGFPRAPLVTMCCKVSSRGRRRCRSRNSAGCRPSAGRSSWAGRVHGTAASSPSRSSSRS